MHWVKNFLIFATFGLSLAIGVAYIGKTNRVAPPQPAPKTEQPIAKPQVIPSPVPPDISVQIPGYLTYDQVVLQLKKWNAEAPHITEIGVYGKSSKGVDIWYIRTCADKTGNKPKVLLTACIHGNEKIAGATFMGILGTYLANYEKDEEVTRLIRERDVYWVPVVSPDSYIADLRAVDGVDPNRNFPYPGNHNVISVAPVAALRNFFAQHNFKAVMSGHAFARSFLYPWGCNKLPPIDAAHYGRICSMMATASDYKYHQLSQVKTYPPYMGYEVDWFYMNGAFAVVCEIGTAFRPPASAILPEVNKVYPAYLIFIKEAPLVNLRKNQ